MTIKNITFAILLMTLLLGASHRSGFAQSIEVSNAKSLHDAILDANDGKYTEIIITGDIQLDNSAIILPALKNIGAPYTIRSKNGQQVTITSNGDQGIFRSIVNFPNGNVTFENVNFVGARKDNPTGPSNGGVFENGSEFTRLNFIGPVTFNDNRVSGVGNTIETTTMGGGAIGSVHKTYGGEQTFLGTGAVSFTNNTSTIRDIGPGTIQINSNGGAILYGKQTFTNIGDVVFRGNETSVYTSFNTVAGSQGGAAFDVRQYYYNQGNVYFENNLSYLQGNGTNSGRAASGGAVAAGGFVFRNTGDVYFRHNSAIGAGIMTDVQGGAAYQSEMLFENLGNVYFTDNIAKLESGVTGKAYGGAIYENAWGGQTFRGAGNVYFQNNMTSGFGGAYCAFASNASASKKGLTLAPQGTGKIIFENNWQQVTDFNDPARSGQRNAIYLRASANASVYNLVWLNPAINAQVLFYDPIQSAEGATATVGDSNHQIIQGGPGTVKLWGDSKYYAKTVVNDGVFQIMNNASFGAVNGLYGASPMGHQFTINGGYLGFEIDPYGTDHGTLVAKNFTANGGKVWVGNVSKLAAGTTGLVYDEVIKYQNTPTGLTGMTINNSLMKATLVDQNDGTVDLHVDNINNISDVFGVEYTMADSQRHSTNLSDTMRIMYDRIYHEGILSDDFLDPYRNVSGSNVLEGAHAYWETSKIFQIAMHDRWPNDTHYVQQENDHHYRGNNFRAPRDTWGRFTQNWSVQDAAGNAAGYDYSPFAFTFGRDRMDGPRQLGIAAQYGHGIANSGDFNWTNTKVDAASIGIYGGRYTKNNYFKANSQIGIGWSKEDAFYAAGGEQTHGAYNSFTLGGSAELGHNFLWGNPVTPFRVTPHIGMDYMFLGSESFSESGDAGMTRHFDQLSYNIGEIPLGIRLAKTWYRGKSRINQITPTVDLMYARSIFDNAPITTAHFLANPTDPWIASGSKMGRDVFRMNVGLTARFYRSWDVNVGYDLESRENYASQQLTATIAWTR